MVIDYSRVNPVSFLYGPDTDLIINQNTFGTQQGLTLNLVNALSGCKDETILNYSDIFLTKELPINDVIYLPPKPQDDFIFSTFLALCALTGISTNTVYTTISSQTELSASLTFSKSLSDIASTYFTFIDINGINCRISVISNEYTKNLTVDPSTYTLYFASNTSATSAYNIFEYSLDSLGFLKLFYRNGSDFYIIRKIDTALSAVSASATTPLSSDIFKTDFVESSPINFKDNFVYYDKSKVQEFDVNNDRSILDVKSNHIVFYNYQSNTNFLTGAYTNIDLFKTKNVLSNNYFINDKLPFGDDYVRQRDYTTILSKNNSETYEGDLQLNYNYYTNEYSFVPDVATKFTLPETLYPYEVINVDNSNLVNAGSYGGLSPVFSDKVVKRLNSNFNTVNYNEANGIYLYTWLYTDSNQLTSYWLDRYYYPQKTSLNIAYSGTANQIFNYTSELSTFLASNYPANNFLYYDIRSSLTFEPSASYIYSRIGSNYINKVVDTFAKAISGVAMFDSENAPQDLQSNISFNGTQYGAFNLESDLNNSFTVSFDLQTKNIDSINSNLIFGNNFDEGLSLYKGGKQNIYTPGYFVNTGSEVVFFDKNNLTSFTLNVSSYVGSQVTVLDIVNTGFDHLIKIFYLNHSNNCPGFLDFSVYNKVFNKYEFNSLANVFITGQRLNLFGKTYKGNNEIWYLVKQANQKATAYIFNYLDNVYVSSTVFPNDIDGNYINDILSYNETLSGIATLSGFAGGLIDNSLGVSKLNNTVYFKVLSGDLANTQYATLCTLNENIFDAVVYDNNFYLLTNSTVSVYDKYKKLIKTYDLNTDSVSGIKLDFINENYTSKLLTYTADIQGNILIDKFDIQSGERESTFNTNIAVDPRSFREFLYFKKGVYNSLTGIGIVNSSFVSAGQENSYTYSTPIINSLTAMPIPAVLGAVSNDCTSVSYLSGLVNFYGIPIPTDVTIQVYQGSTLVYTENGDGIKTTTSFVVPNIFPATPYSLVVSRTQSETNVVQLTLNIENGTFYNGSFRNAVIGSKFYPSDPNNVGTANAFFASRTGSLTDQYGFVGDVNAQTLSGDYSILTPVQYSTNYNFNGYTNNNPLTGFFHNPSNPHLALTVSPDTSSFKPTIIQFTSNLNPPSSGFELLSGYPFQVPTNFNAINSVNKFDLGDFILRADLYSGNNYKNRQTEIIPFDVDNTSQIVISFDVNNGFIKVYKDAELLKDVSLSANTFYTSYFLNNNFGVGIPFINNRSASTIGLQYNDFAKNYSLNNITVYDRPLNEDEVKFNFLKDKTIDPINFDITQGTRNNTDTATSYNKFIIPGRKNNNVLIYIKNAYLNESGKKQLSAQLIEKVKNIIPINSNNIEFKYIDYESS